MKIFSAFFCLNLSSASANNEKIELEKYKYNHHFCSALSNASKWCSDFFEKFVKTIIQKYYLRTKT